MRPRIAVAWVLIAANCAVIGMSLAFARGLGDVAGIALLACFIVVGGLLVIKQPDNSEAWLLLIIGTAWSTAFVTPFEGGWVIPLGLMGTQLVLRFPNGELPSPRWRWFSTATIVYLGLLAFVVTTSDPITEDGLTNSFYISWVHVGAILIMLLPIAIGVSVASFVIRFRRASPVERQQIRWIAWAAATVGVVYTVTLLLSLSSPWGKDAPPALQALQNVALLSFALIPLSIGVAVLKYRLYDIDRVISRTTSYAIVTGLLVATYGIVVTLLGRLVPDSSSLAVAAATLAAAATFRPLLHRVQSAVDRRFNRARYNSVQTVEMFASQLRQVVDPDTVADDLLEVVSETMEPTDVGLWIRVDQH